jgi:hypothetical protein
MEEAYGACRRRVLTAYSRRTISLAMVQPCRGSGMRVFSSAKCLLCFVVILEFGVQSASGRPAYLAGKYPSRSDRVPVPTYKD